HAAGIGHDCDARSLQRCNVRSTSPASKRSSTQLGWLFPPFRGTAIPSRRQYVDDTKARPCSFTAPSLLIDAFAPPRTKLLALAMTTGGVAPDGVVHLFPVAEVIDQRHPRTQNGS